MTLDRVALGRNSLPGALFFVLLLTSILVVTSSGGTSAAPTRDVTRGRQAELAASQDRFIPPAVPVSFIANKGQLDSRVLYYTHGPDYGFYLAPDEAVFGFAQRAISAPAQPSGPSRVSLTVPGRPELPMRQERLALRFVGASPGVRLEGRDEEPGKVNYLIGSDPAKWKTGLLMYREVTYRELWPGIDLVFGSADGRLKSEFILRPGAQVETIRLAYRGAEGLAVDAAGNLAIRMPVGVLTEARPTSYQDIAGRRVPVETRFTLKRRTKGREPVVGFVVEGDYDRAYPLTIDPSLAYSSFLGGTGIDRGFGIDTEPGKVYVTGATSSSSFVAAAGLKQGAGGGGDAFVARLDVAASGSVSVGYLTFIGGSASDSGLAIAVRNGEAYVTGQTFSSNFPVTANAFRKTSGGGGKSDAFVLKLDTSGALSYSTYFGGGGPDIGHAIAVDLAGFAYVVGETQSSNFPVTPFAVFARSQGKADAFVASFDPGGSGSTTLRYSTYLGGSGDDIAWGVAVDGSGNAYLAGQTTSSGFPTTVTGPGGVVGAYDPTYNGNVDAFVAKLNFDGSKLLYSTFFGGTGFDAAYAIALDGVTDVYVTGETGSSNLPITAGAYDPSFNGSVDAFVAKLSPGNGCTGTLCYSTFVGGSGTDRGYGIVVDGGGAAYITGETNSTGSSAFGGSGITATFGPRGGVDAFAAKLSASGASLLSTVFLGGSGLDRGLALALDSVDTAYLTGETASSNFPTTAGAFAFGGGTDAFVAKLGFAVVNTKPTADAKTVQTTEDVAASFNVTASDAETAAADLTYNIADTSGLTGKGTLSGTGPAFTFTPAPNFFGTASFTFTVTDRGAPDNCGPPSTSCAAKLTSDPATVTINVAAVNDAPQFTAGSNQVISEDTGGGQQGWASGISAGAGNETDQTLTFMVTTDNPALFAVQPAIDPTTGNLTYTLAQNANGSATVTVKLVDSGSTGGCATGGDCNTSAEQTFTITVNAVNDPPTFDAIASQIVVEPLDILITGVSPGGGADEAGQTVTLTATSSDPSLVTNLVITGTGPTRTLHYERPPLTQDQAGSVVVTVTADDGQAANNTFPRDFTINLVADNCPGVPNPNQADWDKDGIGNLCDPTPFGPGAGVVTGAVTGFAAGGPLVTVTVTLSPWDRNGDGVPDCYYALVPGGNTIMVEGANVDRTPEPGPLSIPRDLIQVCGVPVQTTAVINLSEHAPGGTLNIEYENLFSDPDLDPQGDGVACAAPPCFGPIWAGSAPVGSVAFATGDVLGVRAVVDLHITDQSTGSTKDAVAPAVLVKVFDRNSTAFQGCGGKTPSPDCYDNIFEASAGQVAACTTDASGACVAGVPQTGDYFVIVKYVDSVNRKIVYVGLPVGSTFVNGLATKEFQIQEVLNNGVFVEYRPDNKTLVVDF